MLSQPLNMLARIVLLRSDHVVDVLLTELLENNVNRIRPEAKPLCETLHQGIQALAPDQYRHDDAQRSLQSEGMSEAQNTNYDFAFLAPIFQDLFTIDGAQIYAQENSAVDYGAFMRKIHPYMIIGRELAHALQHQRITLADIQAFAEHTTPLATKKPTLSKHYAENHIHLFGANETALTLMTLFDRKHTSEKYYQARPSCLPYLPDFTLINNQHYSIGQLIDLAKCALSVVISGEEENAEMRHSVEIFRRIRKGDALSGLSLAYPKRFLVPWSQRNKTASQLLLLADAFKQRDQRSKEFFMICVYLHYAHQTTNCYWRRLQIKLVLHVLNILRSYMVMSQNTGLTHFIDFYTSTLRNNDEIDKRHQYIDIAENIFGTGVTKLDAKIAPWVLEDHEYPHIITALDDGIVAQNSVSAHQSKACAALFPLAYGWKIGCDDGLTRQYHFTVHFIRKPDKPGPMKKRAAPPFYALRKDLERQAKQLDAFLHAPRSQYINAYDYYLSIPEKASAALKYKKNLKTRYLNLANMVVGIDVAGNENLTPPEVYAPAILYLRREMPKTKPEHAKRLRNSTGKNKHRRLGLSVHAGEDFSHIVTGMRRVDETVRFYQMTNRDRLGHALAIGIRPKMWALRCDDVYITRQEHLDNMVWLRRRLLDVIPFWPEAASLVEKYEQQIFDQCRYIYLKEHTPELLYQAWEMRGNCPVRLFSGYAATRHQSLSEYDHYAMCDYRKRQKDQVGDALKILSKYYHDTEVRKRGNEILKTHYRRNGKCESAHDLITDTDLDAWEAIQDCQITEYTQKGLIIEVNPSSNVYIAKLRDYHEHPIFRWNPPRPEMLKKGEPFNRFNVRHGPIHVCVNTDDPAIFATTLPREYDALETAAINAHGCHRIEAENWLEGLRKYGVEIFDAAHEPIAFDV